MKMSEELSYTGCRYHRNSQRERIYRGYLRKAHSWSNRSPWLADRALGYLKENPPRPDDERNWSYEERLAESLVQVFQQSSDPEIQKIVEKHGFEKPPQPIEVKKSADAPLKLVVG